MYSDEEDLNKMLEESLSEEELQQNEAMLQNSIVLEEPDEDMPPENLEAWECSEKETQTMRKRAKIARKKLSEMLKENPDIDNPFEKIRPILEGKTNE